MKIGVYFNSKHLNKWSWEEVLTGEIGLSGTDFQILHLAYRLAERREDLFFFSTQESMSSNKIKNIRVNDLATAIGKSKAAELDILIFNNRENAETVNGIGVSERLKQPCVVWCQNGPSPKIADLLANHSFVRRVVCVSGTQADALRDHSVFDKTEFIYNAIDSDKFDLAIPSNVLQSKRSSRTVVYIGSLTPEKGFQHLAVAWPEVRKVFPEANLIVIGSVRLYDRNSELGPLGVAQPEFEKKYIIPYLGATSEINQDNGVVFRGLVSPKDICPIITSATVGVVNPNCTGSIETFCVSAVEIQACGTAVIGANRGGLRETVNNGVTGILINSEKDLAQTLITLLTNIDQTHQMGGRGKQWTRERFSYEDIIDQWQFLIEAIAKGSKAETPIFAWKRADLKTILREGIRYARRVPLIGSKVPTLRQIYQRYIC